MVIIDRNITSLEGAFKAGQNVEGVLSESACNDLIKRGWAHKSHAKNVADQDDAQTDEQIAEAAALSKAEAEESAALAEAVSEQEIADDEGEETDEESEEINDVVIDSLKELDQALEQPTETGGKSRKSKK